MIMGTVSSLDEDGRLITVCVENTVIHLPNAVQFPPSGWSWS
jgi:hypothetical protein